MALTRWSPFTEMTRMREEMDRMFEEFFPMEHRGRMRGEVAPMMEWMPSVDVYDRNGTLVVEAELPGLKKEEVEVSVEGDMLTIRGEHKQHEEHKEGGVYRSERHYGRFVRTIPLPTAVKGEEAQARFQEGVLCITLPKSEEEHKGKRINVE